MPKFRKKPVVIEAWQNSINSGLPPDWVREAVTRKDMGGGYYIQTLEGEMCASPGDWIIRGVKGEVYPCKPDIFEATYNAEDERTTAELAHEQEARQQEVFDAVHAFFTGHAWLNLRKSNTDGEFAVTFDRPGL